MQVHISRWGNSLAVRIPAKIAKELQFEDGVSATLRIEEGKLVLLPQSQAYTLEVLLSGISEANLHNEVEGGVIGREVLD